MPDHCPTALGAGPGGCGEYHPAALELAAGADLLVHDAQLHAGGARIGRALRTRRRRVRRGAGSARRGEFGTALPPPTRPHRRGARSAGGPPRWRPRGDIRGAGRRDRAVSATGPASWATRPDAVIVGSGPNGLAAALTLARAGLAVEVFEGAQSAGGGCRTEELTLPGFAHDVCSTVHPLLAASPFFHRAALEGVSLRTPEVAFAHPWTAVRQPPFQVQSSARRRRWATDAAAYRRLFGRARARRDGDRALGAGAAAEAPTPTRSRWPASGCGALADDGARPPSPHRLSPRPARRPRAHIDAAAERTGHRRVRLLLGVLAHTVGWPVVEGGSVRDHRRADRRDRRLRAERSTPGTGSPTCGSFHAASVTLLDVYAPPAARAGRRATPAALPTRPAPVQLRPWHLQGRLGTGRAGALAGRGHAGPRRPSTSAAALRRSPAASPLSPPAVTPSAPSASPCSRAWSIQPARRRASRPSTPTATFQPARTWI